MSIPALLATPHTWSRKLLWLLGCVAFFALAYVGHRAATRPTPVESPVDQAVRDTDAISPGWQRADLEAAREAVPDDENSALLVQRAAARLPANWRPIIRFFFYSSLPDALPPGQLARLRAGLEDCEQALAEALALADRPRGRYPFAPSERPWTAAMPHLDQVTQVTALLRLEILRRGNAGDCEGAARACAALLNAARSLGDEPNFLTQLSRKSHDGNVCRCVQYVINHGKLDPATLADLQRRLEGEERHPGFLLAVRAHRADTHVLLGAVESGEVPFYAALNVNETPGDLFWHAPPSVEEVRLRHAELLPVLTRAVALAAEPAPRRAALFHELVAELDPESFRLVGSLVRDLPGDERQFSVCDALLRCAVAAVAAERYRLDHHDWPPSLEALAPDYLGAVPVDPADGQPLRYHRLHDGVAVYSLCRDRTGGQYDLRGPEPEPQGVWVRLWDPSARGRPPQTEMPGDWPRPPGGPRGPGRPHPPGEPPFWKGP
jgi:hypothetical protein